MQKFLIALWVAAFAVLTSLPAVGSQATCVMPTTSTVSGLSLVQSLNSCFDADQTMNSGATAPVSIASGPRLGQLWLRTTDNTVNIYDGTNWLTIGTVDAASHVWTPKVGGGTATLASAATANLCSIPQGYLSISGAVTITSFSNTCTTGEVKFLTFASTPQVTHDATSMILPGAASITAQAGDNAAFVYLGAGNWKALYWTRADGTAVSTSSVFAGAVFFSAQITPTALVANTNNWAPTSLAGANVIRAAASSAISVTGLVAPATDGKVVVIYNVGSFTITLTSQDGSSTAANRFAFDRATALLPGRSLTVIYDLTAARWKLVQDVPPAPIAGSFKRLKITNDATNGTTLNSNMIATADAVVVEDVNGGAARLLSFNCSAALTTSGAGGLDTGSPATGTFYSYWAIYNPTTNTQSCLLSVADGVSTQPAMPAGYTFRARLGWNVTQQTTNAYFLRAVQYGRTFSFVVTSGTNTAALPLASSANTSNVLAAFSLTGFIPVTTTQAKIVLYCAANQVCAVAPNGSYGAFNSSTNPPPYVIDVGSGHVGVLTATVTLETALQAYWQNAGAASALVAGWEDNL